MDYKKIFRTRKSRSAVLKIFQFVPDKLMLSIQYRIKTGRKLNLKSPSRFSEKLQWYKLNYRDPVMHQCVDKYDVREYVRKCGLEGILNECYGVYDSLEDIHFDKLPNQFVIKKTNGGGGLSVLICRNKAEFDFDAANEKMKEWLSMPAVKATGGREWAYNGTKPRVVIEAYLENEKNPEAGIEDYKFFCSNGVVHGLVVDIDRYIEHKRNFYDRNWNYLSVSSDCPNFGDSIEKPEKFEELVQTAEILSRGFPFVRVDLYLVNQKVYFGELTFYPWSGYVQFAPDKFDYELGEKFVLPKETK